MRGRSFKDLTPFASHPYPLPRGERNAKPADVRNSSTACQKKEATRLSQSFRHACPPLQDWEQVAMLLHRSTPSFGKRTMLTATDRTFLKLAYDEAKAGFDEGGCPIGSVLARATGWSRKAATSVCNAMIRLPMARWMRCARQAGRRPIATPRSIPRSAPA